MLFGEGRRFKSLYATHPRLADRIKALNPNFDSRELTDLQRRYAEQPPNGLAEDVAAGFAPAPARPMPGRRAVSPEQVAARAGALTSADLAYGAALHARLPVDVHQLATQPSMAPFAVIALLLAPAGDPLQSRQLAAVAHRLGPAQARTAASLAHVMAGLPDELRLPFVALALPQLLGHPRDYQDALVSALNDLALADDKVTMFEYCVTRLVWSYLRDAADPSRRSRVGRGSLRDVQPLVTTLLATLAVAAGGDHNTSGRAFEAARRRLYGDTVAPEQPRRQTWQQSLDGGWAALDALEPRAKQALIEAMVVSVLDDGSITASEAELLRVACGLMHVPLPALLA
jgi:hypothetical protein